MEALTAEQLQALLADPHTTADELASVAAQYRESWPAIMQHPSVTQELIDWMRGQGFVPPPVSSPELAVPFADLTTGAFTVQPIPTQPAQVGAPGFEGFPAVGLTGSELPSELRAKRGKRGAIIALAVVGVIALVALAVIVPMAIAAS